MTTEVLNDQAWPAMDLDSDAAMPRLNGHQPAWIQAVSRGLGHQSLLIISRNQQGAIDGCLPLMRVESWLFGRFLTSLPYLNTGGVWAANSDAACSLIDRACELADEHKTRYLELRHERAFPHPKFNAQLDAKVHMRLKLPASDAEYETQIKSKVRSQIKKAGQYQLTAEWGGVELLKEFYDVFATNMRDLGTPVYSQSLFREILTAFADDAELCVVRHAGRAVAGALLVQAHGLCEVPSASSLREFNFTNANMWMYRQLIRRSIDRGNHTFDFGRSTAGSGTYKFKAQWGAVPHPAVWQYYVRQGSAEDMRPDSGGKQRLVSLWQRLPVSVSRIIGPHIVRGIP